MDGAGRPNTMGLNPKLVKALKQQSTYNQEQASTHGDRTGSPSDKHGRPQNNYPRAPSQGKLAAARTQLRSARSTAAQAHEQANRSTKIDVSLAMSQIERGVDVSGQGLNESEQRIYQDMTSKLSKEQTELAQIINSAIA